MSRYFIKNPSGLVIIGQRGGANGHFFDVDLLDPTSNEHYILGATNTGRAFIAKTSGSISKQQPLTRGYNINGMEITGGFSPDNDGIYNRIQLINPKNGKEYEVRGNVEGFQMLEIHPVGSEDMYLKPPKGDIEYGEREPNYRKKKTTSKPTRKIVKKCTCK